MNLRNGVIKMAAALIGGGLAATAVFGQTDITDKFLDANFKAEVYLHIGKSAGEPIYDTDVKKLDGIALTEKKVTSLAGIEYFVALKSLHCPVNNLTEIDMSTLTELEWLDVHDNKLTALDVSKNTKLKQLNCYNNRLTTLDVSMLTALTGLECYTNALTALDVSKNTALKKLMCSNHELTELDVSKNTALVWLECSKNKLTALDVSKNTALVHLKCFENRLTALDVSNNAALTWLDCGTNQLTTLNVSNNAMLTRLYCNDNQLTALDVSNNPDLEYLVCNYNYMVNSSMVTGFTKEWNDIQYKFIWQKSTDAVLASGRTIPAAPTQSEAAVIAPIAALTGRFTAGPNPVAAPHTTPAQFFWQGKRLADGALTVYDATGNAVTKVIISDKSIGADVIGRRVVGKWDLRDFNGRKVSGGIYVIRGALTTRDGKSEPVSLAVGVR